MNYDETGGRPAPFRPLRGRRPAPKGVAVAAADRQAILCVAAAHRRWGPRQVYTELQFTGHTVPLDAVEVVMADLGR
jgi:hypothetical protein